EHRGDEEERDGQVLRRRHHAQAEAVGEAGGRQEADEDDRPGGDPAGGVPGGAGDGRLTRPIRFFSPELRTPRAVVCRVGVHGGGFDAAGPSASGTGSPTSPPPLRSAAARAAEQPPRSESTPAGLTST